MAKQVFAVIVDSSMLLTYRSRIKKLQALALNNSAELDSLGIKSIKVISLTDDKEPPFDMFDANFLPCQEVTPEDQAVIFIGKQYSEVISNPLSLANAILKDLNDPSFEFHTALVNAIGLLTKDNMSISASLLKKYKFTENTFNVLKFASRFISN